MPISKQPDFSRQNENSQPKEQEISQAEQNDREVKQAILLMMRGEVDSDQLAEILLKSQKENPADFDRTIKTLLSGPFAERLITKKIAINTLSNINKLLDKEDVLHDLVQDERDSDHLKTGGFVDGLDGIIHVSRKLFRIASWDSENHSELEDIALDLLSKITSLDESLSDTPEFLKTPNNLESFTEKDIDEIYKNLENKIHDRIAGWGVDAYLKQQSKETLIRTLGLFASADSVRPVLNLMKEEPAAYSDQVAPMLSEAAPNVAANEIMSELKKENLDSMYKRDLAKVLYKLELGRIDITEDGVEYLERRYDLRELNNPDFFAKRLSGEGEMGVFDENKDMKGVFDLGDLTDGKKEIEAEVYDLTYEMLFVPKEDETEEERKRREQVLEDFKQHYFDFYGEEFQKETGVYFNNLNLREQGAFMEFMQKASEAQADDALEIIKRYGDNGLKSFVSHAENEDMGEVLLHISNNTPEHISSTVFREYANFVDATNNLENYAEREFDIDKADQFANNIARSMLQQGEDILRKAAENQRLEGMEVLNKIANLSNGALVFLHGLKQLRESETDINPEMIKNCNLKNIGVDNLSQKYMEQMKEIYRSNYPTDEYPPEVQQSLQKKLDSIAESESGEFYMLTYKGEIESFIGFTQEKTENQDERPTKQAAAFNVRPEFQNHAVGHVMIENALAREANFSTLVANSLSRSSLTSHYIERGFVGTQVSEEKGTELLDIVWDKEANGNYRFKPVAQAEIVRLFEENGEGDIAQVEGSGMIQRTDSLDSLDYKPLETGMVMTRLFEHEGGWIAVYEPAPEKDYPESIK